MWNYQTFIKLPKLNGLIRKLLGLRVTEYIWKVDSISTTSPSAQHVRITFLVDSNQPIRINFPIDTSLRADVPSPPLPRRNGGEITLPFHLGGEGTATRRLHWLFHFRVDRLKKRTLWWNHYLKIDGHDRLITRLSDHLPWFSGNFAEHRFEMFLMSAHQG